MVETEALRICVGTKHQPDCHHQQYIALGRSLAIDRAVEAVKELPDCTAAGLAKTHIHRAAVIEKLESLR